MNNKITERITKLFKSVSEIQFDADTLAHDVDIVSKICSETNAWIDMIIRYRNHISILKASGTNSQMLTYAMDRYKGVEESTIMALDCFTTVIKSLGSN